MQQYQIKWKNHQKNFSSALPKYFANKVFFDCQLLVEGTHLVNCHKFVLDSCSEYFASFLSNKNLEEKNLVICLPLDIKLWEIEAILSFMYNGSVAVSQEGLSSLVRVAELLQVKGLCGDSSSISSSPNDPEILPECDGLNESTELVEIDESNHVEEFSYNDQIIKREIDISDVDDSEPVQQSPTSPKIRVKQNLFKNDSSKSSSDSLVYNKKSMDIYVKNNPESSRSSTPTNGNTQFEDIVCSPTLNIYDEEQQMERIDDDDDFIIEESGCNDELYKIISQKLESCEQFSSLNDNEQNSNKLLISSVSSQFNFKAENSSATAIQGLFLRNPRGNQERKYDVNALYSALQDVKNGHSIYRAAQNYSIPRKTLRNWMKRLHIKSAFPMPKQLKQAAERKKLCESVLKIQTPNAIELS